MIQISPITMEKIGKDEAELLQWKNKHASAVSVGPK